MNCFRIFTIMILTVMISPAHVYSQSPDFIQDECGIISCSHYSFENYPAGSHGYGFTLYQNGKVILAKSSNLGGYKGVQLDCIDDTTGFFMCDGIAETRYYVYKLINDTAIYLGSAPGLTYDFFIVSRHSAYIAGSIYPFERRLFIHHVSDLQTEPYLIDDNVMLSDTIVYDTVKGIPFCQGLNSLVCQCEGATGMITYTIIFTVDTLENVNQPEELEFAIVPNPARDFIRIKPSIKGGKYSGCIFNVSGWPEKSLNEDDFNGREIYVGNLKPGIYFLVLRQNDINKVFKIVKL